MRLMVDLTACQTASRHRGLGRYAGSVVSAMLESDRRHDVWLAVNASLPEGYEDLRVRFGRRMPQGRFASFHHPLLPHKFGDLQLDDYAQAVAFRSIQMLAPEVLWTPSPFEGWCEPGVPLLPSPVKSRSLLVATVHDFIPVMFTEEYLDVSADYRSWYLKRLGRLRECDLLIADSEATRCDALCILGIASERIVTVPLAADPIFHPRPAQAPAAVAVLRRHRITRSFVLFTSNTDFRKNVDGMLHGYSLLPPAIRATHQLVLTQVGDLAAFQQRLRRFGLDAGDVIVTGAITDDELAVLYSSCKVFAFPSLYEGFGLPPLEAMACGAPVLVGDNSSLPELVGRDDALFDASRPTSIAEKLSEMLSDEGHRRALSEYGLRRARQYTWAETAKQSWVALEDLVDRHTRDASIAVTTIGRPRIAFVTPLPPSQTGVAQYSSELLPQLSKFFDIEVYVEAPHEVYDPALRASFRICATTELEAARERYAAIVYQFGNSPFHTHMVELIEACPGIAVMHDFYLSNIAFDLDELRGDRGAFAREIDRSHGLRGLIDYRRHGQDEARRSWPINRRVLEAAISVIAHSNHQRELSAAYYGDAWQPRCSIIPQLRKGESPRSVASCAAAKRRLSIDADALLICSFGFLAPTKLCHVIVEGFARSLDRVGAKAHLVFVGAAGQTYWEDVKRVVERRGLDERLTLTGFVDTATYSEYLAAADIAVQLRAGTRGESARTVLDCLAHGIPTIVNAHGSLRDHGDRAVLRLPEDPNPAMLADALVSLAGDPAARQTLSEAARVEIATLHHPDRIARMYAQAILEACNDDERLIVSAAAEALERRADATSVAEFAVTACRNDALRKPPRVLIDVTRINASDLQTGIERVINNLVREFLEYEDRSLNVELVRLEQGRLMRALRFAERMFGLSAEVLGEEVPIGLHPGDCLFMLDSTWSAVTDFVPIFEAVHGVGGSVVGVMYDLIPIRHPSVCHQVVLDAFEPWLREMTRQVDGFICISKSVAEDLADYLVKHGPNNGGLPKVAWAHLGANVSTETAGGIRPDLERFLADPEPYCVVVGTLEPRKGHSTVLDAFDRLWSRGSPCRLCIVGRTGWNTDAPLRRIRAHTELGRRLLWVEDASDTELGRLYANAHANVCASIAEGFGLPIVEAALHGLPSVASDIPVFKEIGGTGALYFRVDDADDLAAAISRVTSLAVPDRRVLAKRVSVLTWSESARQWLSALRGLFSIAPTLAGSTPQKAPSPGGAVHDDGTAPAREPFV